MQLNKIAFFLFAAFLLLSVRAGDAQELTFFKNYFVTGGYVVGSQDLQPQDSVGGMVSGTIPMAGVPLNADILAAFLYWETITDGVPTSVTATFRGQAIGDFAVRVGEFAPDPSASSCWTNNPSARARGAKRRPGRPAHVRPAGCGCAGCDNGESGAVACGST